MAKEKAMQRIVNDPDRVVEDMLRGFVLAHPQRVATTNHPRVLRHVDSPQRGKVGVVTGGGSGHKPAFIGYIGSGLCDAVAVGEVFSSPPATAFRAAFKAADGGAGVACLYGNYAGDNMNVRIAIEMAEEDGIDVRTVVANDDVASAPPAECERRRGVAGEVLMRKVGGAKAAMGGTLEEVIAAARKAIDNTRSIGVGISPCTIPAVGHPNFEIAGGTMEVGIGHHGEPGIEVTSLRSADEIAGIMVARILADMPHRAGDESVVLVSGLGATPVMELYIVHARVHELLTKAGVRVHASYVGNYFTSLDMSGVTATIMKLDDELRECIDYPCDSAGLSQPHRGGRG
jgi:dihydroxyacetone kinase-like protein